MPRFLPQGFGLALPIGAPLGLFALGGASGRSGDAARLLIAIAAKVCSNIFPCMLQPGMRPDVLHSWARSKEHRTGKIPSDFISKGVRGAAVPLQLFTGFHQRTSLPGLPPQLLQK